MAMTHTPFINTTTHFKGSQLQFSFLFSHVCSLLQFPNDIPLSRFRSNSGKNGKKENSRNCNNGKDGMAGAHVKIGQIANLIVCFITEMMHTKFNNNNLVLHLFLFFVIYLFLVSCFVVVNCIGHRYFELRIFVFVYVIPLHLVFILIFI